MSPDRPRSDMKEWDEAKAASYHKRMQYALWVQLWHYDARGAWGDLLAETRKPGYDGEIQ
jgi:hypothetical protein